MLVQLPVLPAEPGCCSNPYRIEPAVLHRHSFELANAYLLHRFGTFVLAHRSLGLDLRMFELEIRMIVYFAQLDLGATLRSRCKI